MPDDRKGFWDVIHTMAREDGMFLALVAGFALVACVCTVCGTVVTVAHLFAPTR